VGEFQCAPLFAFYPWHYNALISLILSAVQQTAMLLLGTGQSSGANHAALLASIWHHAADGRGQKDMVVFPYKDRLHLFSKYLQQLIMGSLGKERGLAGAVVNQVFRSTAIKAQQASMPMSNSSAMA